MPDAKRFHRLIRTTAAQSLAQNNALSGENTGHAVAPTEKAFRNRHGHKQEGVSNATAQTEYAARWEATPVLPPIGHSATVATHQPIKHQNHQFVHQEDRRKKWARGSHNDNSGGLQPVKVHAEHQRNSPSMGGATAFSTLEREATIVLSHPVVLVPRPAPPLARYGASMAARQRIARRKHGNNSVDKSGAFERHGSSVAVPSDVPVGADTEPSHAVISDNERLIKKKREPRPEWISDFAVPADTHAHDTSSSPLITYDNNDHGTSLTEAAPDGHCALSSSSTECPLQLPSLQLPDIGMADSGLPIMSRHVHPPDTPHTVLTPLEHTVPFLHSQDDVTRRWPNVPPRHDGADRHHGKVLLLKRGYQELDAAQESDSSSCGAVPPPRHTNHRDFRHINNHNNIDNTCDGDTTAVIGIEIKGFGSMNGQKCVPCQ